MFSFYKNNNTLININFIPPINFFKAFLTFKISTSSRLSVQYCGFLYFYTGILKMKVFTAKITNNPSIDALIIPLDITLFISKVPRHRWMWRVLVVVVVVIGALALHSQYISAVTRASGSIFLPLFF